MSARTIAIALFAFAVAPAAVACPADTLPRPAGALLTVHAADGRVDAWSAERLRSLGVATWTERRSVESNGSADDAVSAAAYDGVRLRDVVAAADPAAERAARGAVFEAVATDGYRALFSWGELFNSSGGERTIVVLAFNGQPLGAHHGRLALRALGDTRPGPRHVRNLCALRVLRPR